MYIIAICDLQTGDLTIHTSHKDVAEDALVEVSDERLLKVLEKEELLGSTWTKIKEQLVHNQYLISAQHYDPARGVANQKANEWRNDLL